MDHKKELERDYSLPKNLYHETLWYIKRYPEMKTEYENSIGKSVEADGQPKGTGISDPTARDASLRVYLRRQIDPVEKALKKIPEGYREGIINNICHGEKYPDYANEKTWKRWKRRFVFYVAQERIKQNV